mmetsp:Transcript_11134/g.12255  ORF Transcript_11134/g.12255 Transcript_11134/m.12255 type:complete len:196 (-) Transcript_11134:59-646(-)
MALRVFFVVKNNIVLPRVQVEVENEPWQLHIETFNKSINGKNQRVYLIHGNGIPEGGCYLVTGDQAVHGDDELRALVGKLSSLVAVKESVVMEGYKARVGNILIRAGLVKVNKAIKACIVTGEIGPCWSKEHEEARKALSTGIATMFANCPNVPPITAETIARDGSFVRHEDPTKFQPMAYLKIFHYLKVSPTCF